MNDEELDALLHADADADAGPADAGFTLRLMRRLPPRGAGWRAQRITQLMALSLAVMAFAMLWPSLLEAGLQGQVGEAACASLALLALIVGWTLPQLRLNPWR